MARFSRRLGRKDRRLSGATGNWSVRRAGAPGSPSNLRGRRRPFDPGVLGALVGRKRFRELCLEIPRHFRQRIEAQPVGGKVTLLLGEGPAGAVLRAEGERGFRGLGFRDQGQSATNTQTKRDPAGAPSTSASVPTLRRARIAIASRVLETAGASLVFGGGDVDPAGFVLRIPRRFDPSPR